jgi:hypothetical protein
MLDTVLEIGRALRDPENREKALPHHRYVERCPMGEDDQVLRLRIPVTEDFEIDLDEITVIRDERLFEKLLYLKYRTSENDSTMKYIFGDILYTREEGSDAEYYRLSDSEKKGFHGQGSFDRGDSDAQDFIDTEQEVLTNGEDERSKIKQFREELDRVDESGEGRKIDLLERAMRYQAGLKRLLEQGRDLDAELLRNEKLLQKTAAKAKFAKIKNERGSSSTFNGLLGDSEPKWQNVERSEEAVEVLAEHSSGQIFLHFDIEGNHWYGNHWYECESAMGAIDREFVSAFADRSTEGKYEGAVLMKQMYKAIASPNASLQFPEFTADNQNRVRLFSEEELMDLFYAIEMAGEAKHITQSVKIVVLPRGGDMTAEDITSFMRGGQFLEEVTEQEKEFKGAMEEEEPVDEVLDSILDDATDNLVEFDLVFSELDPKGDHDLVELSGVSRSFLQKVRGRIREAQRKVESEYEEAMGRELEELNVYQAFRGLLSGVGQDQPRYQRHLYRMLPKIYTETYHRDPLLLPALVEKAEKSVRDDDAPYFEFNRLNHYFRFLTRIQTTNPIMQITDSDSYELGRPLGVMARPLRSRINPFEKNYVGNLRRRIATLDDLIEFKNEIEEMLVRQEAARMPTVSEARQELSDRLSSMGENARIDKNRCALGFFESYFEPFEENEDE